MITRCASVFALAAAMGLGGCVLPPAVTVASFVADAGSLFATGKTTTDHAISYVAKEDCRVWRGVAKASIDAVCLNGEETMAAEAGRAKPTALAAGGKERVLLASHRSSPGRQGPTATKRKADWRAMLERMTEASQTWLNKALAWDWKAARRKHRAS